MKQISSLINAETTVAISTEEYVSLTQQNEQLKNVIIGFAKASADPYTEVSDLPTAITVLSEKINIKDVVGGRGEQIYSTLKEELERKFQGQFAVIDIDKKKMVAVAHTPTHAMLEAKKLGEKNYFLRKIGEITFMN